MWRLLWVRSGLSGLLCRRVRRAVRDRRRWFGTSDDSVDGLGSLSGLARLSFRLLDLLTSFTLSTLKQLGRVLGNCVKRSD
jgi:hypothetical protein